MIIQNRIIENSIIENSIIENRIICPVIFSYKTSISSNISWNEYSRIVSSLQRTDVYTLRHARPLLIMNFDSVSCTTVFFIIDCIQDATVSPVVRYRTTLRRCLKWQIEKKLQRNALLSAKSSFSKSPEPMCRRRLDQTLLKILFNHLRIFLNSFYTWSFASFYVRNSIWWMHLTKGGMQKRK